MDSSLMAKARVVASDAVKCAVRRAMVRRLRTMEDFAESEIVIPDGPCAGLRYSCSRQPYSRLFFREVDSGRWKRHVATGPSQSGKTLTCFIIPTLYHLFEVGETVICGLPSLDMAGDKWSENLLPAIERSKYRDLLPLGGAGSRGGKSNLSRITFRNGSTLKFMSGGGGDKTRSAFSSRILVITETDGLDESGGSSREADKIKQLKARTRAHDDRAKIYMECTVSLESGRTWQDIISGTDSKIAIRCPHCFAYVTPEREQLIGWQDAKDEWEAGEKAAVVCPSCGAMWSEDDRASANAKAVILHRGQSVGGAGTIIGDLPRTNTLGFRWNAANNMLVKMSTIAQDEWVAARAKDEENAEKELLQFVWAMPHKPAKVDLTMLDASTIIHRVTTDPRGYVPDGVKGITVGIDINKRLAHWVAIAWSGTGARHIVDYGRLEILSDELGEQKAIILALREFRDGIMEDGWQGAGGKYIPILKLVDAGWQDDAVFSFCSESGDGWVPSKGYGSTQRTRERYLRRKRSECVFYDDTFQIVKLPNKPVSIVEINTDYWKSWLHSSLQTPMGQPGALTLFRPVQEMDHLSIAKHFTAEKRQEEFVAGVGLTTRWFAVHRNNHWLDAGTLACVAGTITGLHSDAPQASAPPPKSTQRDDTAQNWIGGFHGKY